MLPFIGPGAGATLFPSVKLAGTPYPLDEGAGLSPLYQLLFGNGEDGFLFGDWTELDELFTTSTGPTNVASDSDSAGLALDDHGWGSRTYAQQLAQTPELISNGDFSTGAIWTTGAGWSISGGQAIAANSSNILSQSIAIVSGRTYRIAWDQNYTSGSLQVRLGGANSGFFSSVGNKMAIVVAGGSGTNIEFVGTSLIATFDNVSVKEVNGNHLLQATGASVPTWRANSGKPYQSFDGVNDFTRSVFAPTAAMTIAAAFRVGGNTQMAIGGGDASASQRLYMGSNGSGVLSAGWGAQDQTVISGGSSIVGTDVVGVLNVDAVSLDLWLNNTLVYSAAPSGSPVGAVNGGIGLGAAVSAGSALAYLGGRVYAAIVRNKKSNTAELSRIVSDFQRTYQ